MIREVQHRGRMPLEPGKRTHRAQQSRNKLEIQDSATNDSVYEAIFLKIIFILQIQKNMANNVTKYKKKEWLELNNFDSL